MKYIYNGLGQKVQQIEDLGGLSLVTEYSYYPDGSLHTVTDPEQHTTAYTYDALGRVTTVVDALSQTTSYAYDSAGNLRSLTDAEQQASGFAYNGLGQLEQESRPMSENTSYTYTASGKLETKTDANNQRTEYVYEAGTNLLTDIYYFDSSDTQTGHVSFTYERGQLSGYDDGDISASYEYNAFGQKLSETVTYPDFSKTFSYGYDANGQKRYFSMPDGTTYSYTYNDNNELEDIRIPGVGNISYPSYTLGLPDSMSSPGDTRSYTYDALARLKALDSPTLEYSYSYDDVGNILTKTTKHGNYVYDYDDVYRLMTADNPTLDDEAYTYDGVGNRETASGVSGAITHNANNELTVYGEISYEYDANGNMIRKSIGVAAVNYIYDATNRLVKVEDEATQTVIAEYDYDPFGRRLWKEVDGTRTYFLYADEGLVAEYDENGVELRSYGYQPDSTWTTDPLFLKQEGSYYWYQNDHLGTPQKLVDSTGTVVWSAQYTAFGEAVVDVSAVANNLRFPGQYADTETGLHYNWFRYYDPGNGRYLRTDPIGFDGGDVNWYAYVWNSPVNFLDPSGLVGVTPLHRAIIKSLKGIRWLFAEYTSPEGEIRSPRVLQAFVPGQVAWDDARNAWRCGKNTEAALAVFRMLLEQLMAVALANPSAAASWWNQGAEMDAYWRALSMKEKLFYEIGQKTLPDSTYGLYSNYADDAVAMGKALVKEQGWGKAILSSPRGLLLGAGKTLDTGPTPLFRWLVPRLAGGAGIYGALDFLFGDDSQEQTCDDCH